MKQLFPSYYPLDEQELNELWENATFVFDTNTLLNLFRYKESTSQNILEILGNPRVKERIFIPHQVALELHRNYSNVMSSHTSDFDNIINIIENNMRALTDDIKAMKIDDRHPEIDPKTLISNINSFKEQQIDQIKTSKNNYNFRERSQSLLKNISDIISNKIGNEFSADELKKESSEAEKRIDNKIPPGYKDNKKSETFIFNQKEYSTSHGDYLFWKQTINHCKSNNIKHLIIITNDNKDDWWKKGQGQQSLPRVELREEIRNEAGIHHFTLYSQQDFLREVSQRYMQKVEEETLNDIKSTKLDFSKPTKENLNHLLINEKLNTQDIKWPTYKNLYDFLNLKTADASKSNSKAEFIDLELDKLRREINSIDVDILAREIELRKNDSHDENTSAALKELNSKRHRLMVKKQELLMLRLNLDNVIE